MEERDRAIGYEEESEKESSCIGSRPINYL